MSLLYVTLGSNDLLRSRAFYDSALAPLGLVCGVANDEELGYGPASPKAGDRTRIFYVVKPLLPLPATWGNGTMLALKATTRAQVDQFYAGAMAHGGIDEGAPGLRPYSPNFYAAYVRDPDGNKLSVVCETAE
ncbi:MAG: VOC family protein [Alphaproteobacteria bacterium]|nr:VOC family protein [Alphaproteobacteria bacterium]